MAEKIILELANGEKISGLMEGNGNYPCLIVGPGSFYLDRLSDDLKKKITFFTFDQDWTREKDAKERKAPDIEFSKMVCQIKEIVLALRSQYKYPKIGLMGFSAPALIALQAAIDLPEKDLAFVIAIGCALTKLDPEFKATNARFLKEADEPRKKQDQWFQQNFSKLSEGTGGDPLPDSNFIDDADTKKRRLTPNSKYVEMCRSLIVRLLYDYEKYEAEFLKHWRFNADRKVINEPTRQYFFNNILKELDPGKIVKELENKSKVPALLVYGHGDYITAIEEDILNNLKRCQIIRYAECGHSPSEERTKDFDEGLIQFIKSKVFYSKQSFAEIMKAKSDSQQAMNKTDVEIEIDEIATTDLIATNQLHS